MFPNAARVVSRVDRLMYRAEVVRIEGESYIAKEADEREAHRRVERAAKTVATRSRRPRNEYPASVISSVSTGNAGTAAGRGEALDTRASARGIRMLARDARGTLNRLRTPGSAGLTRSIRARRRDAGSRPRRAVLNTARVPIRQHRRRQKLQGPVGALSAYFSDRGRHFRLIVDGTQRDRGVGADRKLSHF